MEEARTKYILLNDRVGENLEKNLLTLGFSTKSSPTQVLRGELLEALPEDEQPEDSRQIALVGLERKSLRLTCRTEDLTRLSDEDANLLLAISSTGGRYDMFIDRKRLEIGRKIQPGSRVYVKVKGVSKDILGVAWYKGELPSTVGTMFGVELIENRGQGTTDGTFRNKKYFACAEDSGVFVSLDKITNVKEGSNRSPSSPKKQSATSNIAAKVKETFLQPFMKEKDERLTLIQGTNMAGLLDIGQRVVAYMGEKPVRGYVRYIGEEQDRRGQPFTIVGLELESRCGCGTGIYNGKERFVCKKDFATFLPIEAVIPEKDFDNNSGQLKNSRERRLSTAHKDNDDVVAKSLNYSVNESASQRGNKSLKRSNSMDSAEVIKAAGEPSKTNPTEFIEKQRQILRECNYGRLQNNEEATKSSRNNYEREDSGATEMEFDEDHYMSMSSDILNAGRDNRQEQPITKQPGFSSSHLRKEESEGDKHYSDYVHIDKHDYEGTMDPHIIGLSYPKSSKNTDEVTVTNFVMDKSKASALANDVVVDCRNEEELDHPQDPKEPYEHLDMAISPPLKVEAVDISKTGVDNSHSTSVGIPHDMEVGSMVEVPMAGGIPRYGVIRWIGYLPQMKDKLVAGLELEDEQPACSDGTFYGARYFTCPSGRGFFTLLVHCRQDSRFTPDSLIKERSFQSEKVAFGSIDSPIVPGITAPPSSLEDHYCGRMHGLQGHHNSCYLDATLYSMFAFTIVFDSLLHRERGPNDLNEYNEVQTVLREHIVNPLRKNGFVRADRLLHLRTLLDKLSSTSGLTNEEKDPEEFLNSLLQQVLKADPYLRVKSRDTQTGGNQAGNNEGAYLYQIITEKDETTKMVEVYQLLEQSFLSADLILSEVPSCLILQMPRFGSRYKMYEMILPNLELDITHLVENVPRECDMCGTAVAHYECKACYKSNVVGDRKGVSSYCTKCNETVHKHRDRLTHSVRPLVIPRTFSQHNNDNWRMEKQTMELFAVVCIETSHYVAFVKCGTGKEAPWCFFDSMADRKGERNGYNIPAVTPCPEALEWLSKKTPEILAARDKGEIPEKARRLLGDSYLCMYQNLEMTMYK